MNGNLEENPKRKPNKTILDNFSNITKPQEGVRLKSSLNLLKYLAENTNGEKENELNYALGRIIRGLGSTTVNAKAGFYSTLIGLLDIQNDINIDKIFEYLQKELHKSSSFSKGENADVAAGQILACGAIIKSQSWIALSDADMEKIISLMLKASKERSYLGLLCYKFIIAGLEKLQDKRIKKLFQLVLPEISKPWGEQNLDTLYLLISIKNKWPNLFDKTFLNKFFGNDELICEENLDELSLLLLTVPRATSVKHPVYEIISKELASSELLKDFINHLDNNLVTWNRNKMLVLINIYTIILPEIVKTSQIPSLLSKNFIKHTLNYFKSFDMKNKDPEFKERIYNFFNQLVTTVKADKVKSKTKVSLLKKLLFSPGTFIFEKITKSKIVQHLTASLDNDGVKNLAVLYTGVIEGMNVEVNDVNEKWINNDRLYATHLLIKLLNHPAVKSENQWKVDRLCFLISLGFFKTDEINIGSELAASLRTAFYGALNLKLTKLEDLLFILVHLVYYMDSKLTSENYESVLKNPISEQDYNTWQKTVHIISKIEKKKRRSNLKSVFLTLFVSMGLQLFNDSKLATDSLNELFICYEKTRKNRKTSINSEDSEMAVTEENDQDPLWIEVVVDLFLNLLSQNSHLLRNIINCVFPHLCQYLTPNAVHHILEVLDPKNEDMLSRFNENSDDESDEDETMDVDSKDKEEENKEQDEEEEKSEEESNDDDDDDDGDDAVDMDEDETGTDKLRMALQQVLSKSNGYQSDEESVDLDQLSETEGKELDKGLSSAFKQYRPNKGKSRKQNRNEEALTHFRVRVLDLIEIYLDSMPSMILTLEIMLPLLQAIEFSIRDEHQRPLYSRLKSCLKKLTNLKKFGDADGIEENVLQDLLKSLLEKGSRTSWITQDMGVEIADCCIFIVKCSNILYSLKSVPKKTRKKIKKSILEVIKTELEYYFHKRDSITPIVLFKHVMQLSWDGTLELVCLLLQFVFKPEIKPFKKTQSLELLKLFYLNQRYLSLDTATIQESLNDSHSEFSQSVVLLFQNLSDNPSQKDIKEKFICNLFNLLFTVKGCCLNVSLDWDKIGELVSNYRGKVSFSRDAKVACNKLCNRLGVNVKRKVQVPQVDSAEVSQEVKMKRKKKQLENKVKKKTKV